MAVPAPAVGFVFSGALVNLPSSESVAFSFSWHPGATPTVWQARHGKLLGLVIIPKRCSAHASKEVLVKALGEYAANAVACWIVLRGKIVTLLNL
jgi:hypothetical protein